MEDTHRNILRQCRMTLCSEIDPDTTSSQLVSSQIFSESDRETVLQKSTVKVRQNEQLLDTLVNRGPQAFGGFLEVLKNLGLKNLVQLISPDQKMEKNEVKQNEATDAVDAVRTPRKQARIEQEEKEEDALDSLDGPVKKNTEPAEESTEDGRLSLLTNMRGATRSAPLPTSPLAAYAVDITDPEECYPMASHPRGLFVIVNNKKFLRSSGMQDYPRNGTDVDAKAITDLFQELGFDVQSYKNQSCSEMRRIFKSAATMDFKRMSALSVCVLSHGQEGVIYGTDGTLEIKEITGLFRGSNLAGKPKMFFFQACQGSEYMDGITPDEGVMETDGAPEYGNDISLPTEADFIYAYSTVPGYYSWRNSAKGSWFIQAIVEVFRQYAHKMDVLRMLTRVNRIVSTKKSLTGQAMSHHKRQISSVISQLRKDLFLCPPHGPLRPLNTLL